MSSISYSTWDNIWYMSWREWDPSISIVIGLENEHETFPPPHGGCFYITYKEFIDLADFLGFNCVPRPYRMELSGIDEKGNPV